MTSPSMIRLPRLLTRALTVLALLAGVAFAAILVMILWGDPQFTQAIELSPEQLADLAKRFEQPYLAVTRTFRMRDGVQLSAQYLAADSKTTIVLVHGIFGSSFPFNTASGLLREATGAAVVAVDLRGHGASEGAPGDTAYAGQYEHDLGDLIRQLRADRPAGRVILAGHSMGGGIALRYAQRGDLPAVDGYLLLAPYLGWSSPTTRKEPAAEDQEFMKVHLSRILGLELLNGVGVTAFDGLRTHFANLPPELPLRSYSHRAMAGSAPEDYARALAAVEAPLLVVVGSEDEAFLADRYEEVVHAHSRGEVTIVPGAHHNDLVDDPRAVAAVAAWAASAGT